MTVSVPVPYTWVDGEKPTYLDLESRLASVIDFCMAPPFLRLKKTNIQNVTTSTVTPISWNFVEAETDDMWNSAQPTRIKPSTPGWYVGTTGMSFDSNSTGYREMLVRKNGTTSETLLRVKISAFPGGQTSVARGNVFLEQFNGTTDYIEVNVWQNSGSTLAILYDSTQYQPDVLLRWVAPL